MVVSSATIDSLLKEKEEYPPPKAFRKEAWVRDRKLIKKAAANPERYWADRAREFVWIKKWSKVLEWKAPFAKWFVGGRINITQNCLDRHLDSSRRNKAAIVWEGEPGDRRVLTYQMVWREVNRFANVLKGLGVNRGDRVTIYMPMIPELPIAMLACARIGAIHSVIFGGFSAKAIQDRAEDSHSEVLVTADGGYRRGAVVPLKKTVDAAIEDLPFVRHVVVCQRTKEPVSMNVPDDVAVGFEEVETREFAVINPADLLEDAVLHLAFIFSYSIKMELHCSPTFVLVLDGSYFLSNRRRYAQLFIEFAAQSGDLFLPGLDFSAREFPFQGHGLVFCALANQ